MKPLPVALLIPLDAAIWLWVDARMDGEREYAMHTDCRKADRRDADLMLRAQCQRQWLEGSGSVPALPPWLLPFEWNCGPVGGDIARYITQGE